MICNMKTSKLVLACGMFLSLISGMALAAGGQGVDLGVRYHQKHSEFTSLPFGDGDLSYGAGYEIRDENGLVQLLCSFTPEFADREDLDFGVTPELNLLAVDRGVQGGVGILSTYTQGGTDDGWMDLYWQLILGLNIPLGTRLSLQANAYYVFESWNHLGDFDFGDIEYGGCLSYSF